MRARLASFGLAALCVAATPTAASAFCGFYVSGADGKLYNRHGDYRVLVGRVHL